MNITEIQKYYDEGNSLKSISKKFGISQRQLYKAIKSGDLKTRSKSETSIIQHKKKKYNHSDETKRKLSEIRKKYLQENPDKVPYLLNHSSHESYPEKYFAEVFENENFNLQRYFRIGLYELDFCSVKKKVDIEIDGNQHYTDEKIIESDKRRDQFLRDFGWEIVRIEWKEFKKLNDIDRRDFIQRLKGYLNNIEEKPCFYKYKSNKKEKVKKKVKKEKVKNHYSLNKICKCCSDRITNYTKNEMCVKCQRFNSRKVERPSLEQLKDDVEKLGYTGTGKKYGVSDNAIRKWLKII
jgi:very-short-patch-repair endonuclease/transposase-like protein